MCIRSAVRIMRPQDKLGNWGFYSILERKSKGLGTSGGMKAVLLEMEKQLFGRQLDPEQTVVSRSCQVPGTARSPDPGGPGDGLVGDQGLCLLRFQAVKGWRKRRLKWEAGCLLSLKNRQPEVTLAGEAAFWGSRLCFPARPLCTHRDPLLSHRKESQRLS